MTWTQERHEAAKARCDAATPGPWFYKAKTREGRVISRGDIRPFYKPDLYPALAECHSQTTALGELGAYDWEANAAFIADARTDLPDALAEVERLQAKLAAAQEELAVLRDTQQWVPVDDLDDAMIDLFPDWVEVTECVLYPKRDGTNYQYAASRVALQEKRERDAKRGGS